MFSHKAFEDVQEAVEWYEEQKQGLGIEFTLKLEEAKVLLESNPELYRKVEAEIRKMSLKKFPYALFYEIDEPAREVGIIAVLHHKRGLEAFKKRLKLE
ncbi:type II toxin-antitoxin system RelE/ParE family toxin [Flexithrix dorotheae]|uniref:type II toxin-antitoxin system RelE/ParE family toxin n=1 Tax=Flexithrix dorotheae TaxID=70993 RepID=UPI0009FF4E24|nr:type II toxin-antitoxin system RelE/ParE family toxin [Flexithrix dorotheae]